MLIENITPYISYDCVPWCACLQISGIHAEEMWAGRPGYKWSYTLTSQQSKAWANWTIARGPQEHLIMSSDRDLKKQNNFIFE